jgi:hypothetical protein
MVYVNAQTKKESGNATSSASAATTITLVNEYFTWRRFTITPYGTTQPRPYVIDNIVMNPAGTCSFDVYIFNSSGTQVAQTFNWNFEGV